MTHVALPTINGLALCAGVGMLDEGVRLAFEHLGFDYRTVAYVEREAPAAAQLVTLMEAGLIDSAPIWSDLCTFDTRPWRGIVDSITAGFPCQPHSVAGKRAGLEDDRWIWPDIARLIGELRPRFVLLENVPGLASTGGLDGCIGDLAERGYSAEWARLSAAAVGASHERERLFIFGWSHGDEHSRGGVGLENASRNERPGSHWESGRRRGVREASNELGDTAIIGRREGRPESVRQPRRSDPFGPGSAVDDANRTEWRQTIVTGTRCSERSDTGRQAPSRSRDSDGVLADPSSARPQGRELAEACDGNGGGQEAYGSVSQLCGAFAPGPSDQRWPGIIDAFPFLAPATEPSIRGVADGLALVVDESRTDQLRAIGNGVVPLTAAAAFVLLARRAGLNIFY